ncbi:MAG: MBL fold metallo-hydrolase [Deltaproteobacteria bacterium]|nr:MBL fold metallo-hydrolase [Deltaproteobacteria bacterium]
MKITILGSGTCVPRLERSASSVLVRAGEETLVFDTGPGTIRRLLEAGTEPGRVSAYFYTHLHPDHSADFVPMIFSAKYGREIRRPFSVAAGQGFSGFYEALKIAYGHWIELEPGVLAVRELSVDGPDSLDFSGVTVKSLPVLHTPASLAYRVEEAGGKSLVISGDTDYCENLVELTRGCDMFICEAALPDELKVEGHLTPSLTGRIASEAGVGHLVLTHIYPECDAVDIIAQCRRTWAGPLTVATDLMELSL